MDVYIISEHEVPKKFYSFQALKGETAIRCHLGF